MIVNEGITISFKLKEEEFYELCDWAFNKGRGSADQVEYIIRRHLARVANTPKETPTEWQSILTNVGPKQISVIKEIRMATGCSLRDAKDVTNKVQGTYSPGYFDTVTRKWVATGPLWPASSQVVITTPLKQLADMTTNALLAVGATAITIPVVP